MELSPSLMMPTGPLRTLTEKAAACLRGRSVLLLGNSGDETNTCTRAHWHLARSQVALPGCPRTRVYGCNMETRTTTRVRIRQKFAMQSNSIPTLVRWSLFTSPRLFPLSLSPSLPLSLFKVKPPLLLSSIVSRAALPSRHYLVFACVFSTKYQRWYSTVRL